MVTDYYGTLLQEISEALEIDTLEPDEHHTCLVKFINGLEVQIEPDKRGNHLLIGVNLGQVPAGRYREDVFGQALKANGLPYPRSGTFAFSEKADSLVLFDLLPLKELTGQKVVDAMDPFMNKANKWKEALEQNAIPEVRSPESGGGAGLFGLVR